MNRSYNRRRGSRAAFQTISSWQHLLLLIVALLTAHSPALAADNPARGGENATIFALRLDGGWLYVSPPAAGEAPSYARRSTPAFSFSVQAPALYVPTIIATKTDAFPDPDTDGMASPGETITYTVVLVNSGADDALGVVFEDTIDPNTTFVNGTLQTTPLALDDAYASLGNVGITVPAANGVLVNDVDPDGSGLGSPAITAFDATSAQGGTVTFDPGDGSFSYVPPAGFEGVDTFTYTIDDGEGNTDTGTVTVTVSDVIWFVDNSAAAPGDGRLNTPFNTLEAFNAANGSGGANDPAAGECVFLAENGAGAYTGGVVLEAQQTLVGEGASDPLAVVCGVTPPPFSEALPATGGPRPVITNAGGAGVTVAADNLLRGFDVGTTTGAGISGTSFGTLAVSEVAVAGAGRTGQVLDLATGTLSASFSALATTASGGPAIELTGLTAASVLTVPGGTSLTGLSGDGIVVQNADGATLSFGATVVSTTSGDAIDLATGNTGATFSFASLDVDNTNGNGLLANDSGTIHLGGTASTIDVTGGAAVNVQNTSLGAGWTLVRVSAATATNGIVLHDAPGGFTVAGDGSGAQNGSGGTITSMLGNGIDLEGVDDVVLASMSIQNSQGSGIFGLNVDGFSLVGSVVAGNGNAVDESGVRFGNGIANGLTGVALLQNVLVEQSPENNVEIINTAGTVDLSVIGSTFDFDAPFPGLRNHNVQLEMRGTAQATIGMSGNTFEDTGSRGVHVQGFQDAVIDFTFTNNAITRVNNSGNGVHVTVTDNADVTFDISENGPFTDVSAGTGNEAIALTMLSTSTANASLIGTVARNGNITNSGGFLKIDTRGQGKVTISVEDNGNVGAGAPGPISTNREAIDLAFGDSGSTSNTGDVDVTITGNTISKVANTGDAAFYIEQFTKNVPVQSPNVCVNIRGNTASVPAGSGDDAYVIFEDTPGDIQLESGPTDCGGACANAEAHILANNAGTPVDIDDLTLVPPGTCAVPPAPTAAARQDGLAPRSLPSLFEREAGAATPIEVAQARRPAPAAPRTPAAAEVPAASISAVLAGETITVPIGTLPAGKDITITWDVTITNAVSQVANQGTVSGSNFADVLTDDPDTPAPADPTVTPVEVLADLSLTKTDTPDPVVAGTNLTYTLTLTNDGPDGAANVAVNDPLPANTTFVSAAVTSGTGWNVTAPAVGGTGTVTFDKAAVAAAETATFEIVVAVDSGTADGATITNTATATSDTPDPDPSDDAATTETTVEGVTDLSIDKADDPDPVVAGSNLTYTLTFANNGPNAAADVVVSDAVPANTTFVSAAVTSGTGWNVTAPAVGGTGTVTFDKAAVADGETATFEIVVEVDPGASGVIENTATVTSATVDPNAANDTVTIETAVTGEADLAVTKTDAPDPVVVGSNLTYTITFANAGPSAAGSVVVSDAVPANTTFVSAAVTSGTGWNVTAPAVGGTGTVTFDKAAVADGEAATFQIVVAVDVNTTHGSTITNTVTAASATTDPNAANNTASTETAVLGAADLAITKTDSPDPVEAGANITYTLTLVNNGPAPAGVTVSDAVPTNTTFVSAAVTSGSGWNVAAPPAGGTGTVTFDKATVAATETATFQIVVKVNNGAAGATITNLASATGTVPDPDTDNNTATTETDVVPALAHPYLLLADERIKVDGAEVSIGDFHSNDDIDIHKGNPTTYEGDLTARDDIDIDKSNTIDGDVTAGDDIDLKGNATVTGTATEDAPVALVPLPSLSFSAGGSDLTVPKNQSQTLAPGSYDEVKVQDGGVLNMSSGVYFIDELEFSKDATLVLDVTAGTITINVVDELKFDKNMEIVITPGGEAQSRWVTFNSRADVDIHKDSRILGTFYAPDDKVKIDKNTYFRGSIAAEEIDIHKDVTLLHHDAVVLMAAMAGPQGEMLAGMATETPTSFALGQNYPNPFNPSTEISFDLPEQVAVRLTVYDVLGREVARLVDGVVAAGRHQVRFEASNLPSGIYFLRMQAADFAQVRQMILLK